MGESHSDKYVTMSRWNDGTTGGVFYSVTGGFIYTAKQGFHHVIGAETKAPPTSGSVSYTLAAKTSATMDDGSLAVGTITGKAKVNFSASGSKVAMEISVAMPGDTTYKLNTKGGLADPTQSSVKLTGGRAKGWFNLTAVGKACPAGCAVSFEGFLAGPNAERLGFVFVINNNNAKAVRGAVVFKK